MPSKSRIAIFASGNGSNAEEIIKYFKDHDTISVVLLLSNNPRAFALERAGKHQIKHMVFNREQFADGRLLLETLREAQVTHLVLAGFLWMIPGYLLSEYPDRIVNIHPALLPRYGGKGMYGERVHKAVKAAGDIETGITIHLVNDQYDEGRILFQKKCEISSDHTPDQIAECVHRLEHAHYPRVIEDWILNNPLSY